MKIKDGDWELFEHDPATGRTVWRYFDGTATHVRTDYPVDHLIQQNTEALNDSQGQRFGEGQRVASIPLNTFFEQLQEAHAQEDAGYVSRWLNDGDNRAFRTFGGNV